MKQRVSTAIMLAACVMAASADAQQPAGSTAPMVMFVCEHGAAKSVVATLYFNKMAAERGLPYRAIYRGATPQENLSVATLKGLAEDGFALPSDKPSPVAQSDVDTAQVVFALGCTLPDRPGLAAKAHSWDDVPEITDGYAKMRDAIVRHVRELLDQLAKG